MAEENDPFDAMYRSGEVPWVIGEPQPAVAELEKAGAISGSVIDVGCGTGENTLLLARLGYDVIGVDFSQPAIDTARAHAQAREIEAKFDVVDALDLGSESRYDTVVDSALFHVFDDDEVRGEYATSLHKVCRPKATVHILALTVNDDAEAQYPQIKESAIRDAFGGKEWEIAEITSSTYRANVDNEGNRDDLPALLARIQRKQ